MQNFFRLALLLGLGAFTIGCGGASTTPPASPEPTADELDDMEGIGTDATVGDEEE